MNAMKNATHLVVLLVWAALGLFFSVTALFAHHDLSSVLGFWLWFAGFAALTSTAVTQFNSPLGSLGVHASAFVLLNVIPRAFPFSLLRLGYDLLAGHR